MKIKFLLSLFLLSQSLLVSAGELAYVTNEKDDNISVIDIEQQKVIREIAVGQRPRGIIFNHDQSLAYICASDSDRIQILDLATEEIVGELPSGEDPEILPTCQSR